MPFSLREEDLSFFSRAHLRLDFTHLVPRPPAEVFAILADHHAWARWFKDFKRAKVTSASDAGVGTTRRVHVGPLILDERFIAWTPGERFSFTMTSVNLPILAAMVEDWRLTAAEGGTRVDYTVAVDLPWWLRAAKPVLLARFKPMLETALPNLAAYARR